MPIWLLSIVSFDRRSVPPLPGRRLRPDLVDSAVAERVAKIFARAEQWMLDSQSRR
jgi:hypothetical protein